MPWELHNLSWNSWSLYGERDEGILSHMFTWAPMPCLLTFCLLQSCRVRVQRTKHPFLALTLLYIKMAPLSLVECHMTWKESWFFFSFSFSICFSHLVRFPPLLGRCQDKGMFDSVKASAQSFQYVFIACPHCVVGLSKWNYIVVAWDSAPTHGMMLFVLFFLWITFSPSLPFLLEGLPPSGWNPCCLSWPLRNFPVALDLFSTSFDSFYSLLFRLYESSTSLGFVLPIAVHRCYDPTFLSFTWYPPSSWSLYEAISEHHGMSHLFLLDASHPGYMKHHLHL